MVKFTAALLMLGLGLGAVAANPVAGPRAEAQAKYNVNCPNEFRNTECGAGNVLNAAQCQASCHCQSDGTIKCKEFGFCVRGKVHGVCTKVGNCICKKT